MVSTPVTHVISWITTHLPILEEWKAELAWLDTLPTKWSHVSHRSGKVCQPKTDVLTTEPRRQLSLRLNHAANPSFAFIRRHRTVDRGRGARLPVFRPVSPQLG